MDFQDFQNIVKRIEEGNLLMDNLITAIAINNNYLENYQSQKIIKKLQEKLLLNIRLMNILFDKFEVENEQN